MRVPVVQVRQVFVFMSYFLVTMNTVMHSSFFFDYMIVFMMQVIMSMRVLMFELTMMMLMGMAFY